MIIFCVKRIAFVLLFTLFSVNLNSQISGKTKGFQKVYKVNAELEIDSIETLLLESFSDSTINNFFTNLNVDTLVIQKKFKIDNGMYIFLSKYDDNKSLIAPYECSFVDLRFSRIAKYMVFLMYIKSSYTDDEFNLEYGQDKLLLN